MSIIGHGPQVCHDTEALLGVMGKNHVVIGCAITGIADIPSRRRRAIND